MVIALGAWFERHTSAGILNPAVEKTMSLWRKCHGKSLVLAIVILVGFLLQLRVVSIRALVEAVANRSS